ncbi:MAG: CPBP family glutamic-type intramembrane protease [Candidatus Hodarchaeales archaeon]|jgi:hypothetical protein
MRNFEIVEIENSFLNFFTPAVLVAISYFLLNLIGWPSFLLRDIISRFGVSEMVLNLLYLLISILCLGITCGLLYYLLIYLPRLKAHEAEFKRASKMSMYITIIFSCLVVSSGLIIVGFYEFIFEPLIIFPSFFFPLEIIRNNLFYLILNLIYDSVLMVLFQEIVYRRALIPMLEDRGLSPFHAVILAALGNSFIDFPIYLLFPKHPIDVYSFIISLTMGLFAGLLYIITRNIIFPVLLSATFSTYNFLGVIFTESQMIFYDAIHILTILSSLIIIIYLILKIFIKNELPIIIKIMQKRSSSNILKGVVGFFIFSLGLLVIQVIVVKIGHILFITTPGNPFPEYFIYIMIFYAIAFLIPFFLTISTEWAADQVN